MAKPRACAYSNQPTVNRGFTTSAWATIGFMLSGTRTLNTPPKNRHAASQPATIASNVVANVNHKTCAANTPR